MSRENYVNGLQIYLSIRFDSVSNSPANGSSTNEEEFKTYAKLIKSISEQGERITGMIEKSLGISK